MPPDRGVVAPIAGDDETPDEYTEKEVQTVRRNLITWKPGFDRDEVQRVRNLLLKQKELRKITIALTREGMTLVPLKLYFTKRGKAKLLLGLAKGKNTVDKRASIKERDWNKEKARTLREKNR